MNTQDYIDFLSDNSNIINRKVVLKYSLYRLENEHNYIQWLFPTAEKSNYNSNAPILDLIEFTYYLSFTPIDVKFKMLESFNYVARLWGIEYSFDKEEFIVFDENRLYKLNKCNHNTLRFSRILRSFVYHGLKELAYKLLVTFSNDERINPSKRNDITLWEINYLDAVNKFEKVIL